MDSVRHLFPQLLKNGYVPLPNRDKACYLPKWSMIQVNEDQCQRWTRQSKWPAIGLRVEPPLLVLDYDIPDINIIKTLRNTIPPTVLEEGLERQGNPPKTAFFLRLADKEEPFHEAHTRRYTFTGAPKPAFAVQAFAGGGGGQQFGAFGPHSHDARGQVLRTYSWINGRSPAKVHIDELPELTRKQVFALLDAADAVLSSWPGLVIDPKSKPSGESPQEQVYDLTETMLFHDTDSVEYSYAELIEEAKARKELGQPEMRITGSFTNDPASSGSPRAKVYWHEFYGLSIVDFKTSITHRPLVCTQDPNVQRIINKYL
jgi:hypothetical protein